MRSRAFRFLALGLALAVTSASGPFQESETQSTVHAATAPLLNSASNTIYLNLGPDDPTIDPSLANPYGTADHYVVNQLFIGLVKLDAVSREPLPHLATSWSANADATQFTFTLRNDATWSDGSPVTASDVRYGILRSLDPATGSSYAFPLFIIANAKEYNDGTVTDPNLVGVTVLDSTHIQFDLDSSAAHLPAILALPIARPLPELAITANPSTWTEPANIVTNGAYELTTWDHGNSMILDKSNDYFGAANVQIEQVQFTMVDEDTAWGQFQSGQLDSAVVPAAEWPAANGDPILQPQLHLAPGGGTNYYGFNTSKAPFDNVLVRKAFVAAINRQGVVGLLDFAQQTALTFTAPGVFGHVIGSSSGIGIVHNPAQAQQWLADAGYPGGTGLPAITLAYNVAGANQTIAEYIRQNWIDNLSITVTLFPVANWNTYLGLLNSDAPQVWRLGWVADFHDAHNFLNDAVILQKASYGNWSNTTYEDLLTMASAESDPATRKSYFSQAEEILVETDAVQAPLFYGAVGYATNPGLERTYNRSGYGVYIEDWILLTFTDVPTDHWAYPYIEAIAGAGLTAGYPDGTYRPDNPVTRAEMAVFIKKGIHGSTYTPPALDGSHPFNDIAGHWAEAWIEDLYDEGMTSGFPDGTYRPENQVTRAEMAVFLKKAIHGSAYTSPAPDGSHPFSDIASHWAEAWIEDLYDEGITSGYPDGTYRPENQVTRAEMAVFLVNAFGLPLP